MLKLPDFHTHLTQYKRLKPVADNFARGLYNLCIVVSGPGRGKTTTFLDAVERRKKRAETLYYKGIVSAFSLYQSLSRKPDALLILDDIDFGGPDLQNMLLAVCDTTKDRPVSWDTDNRRGLPPQIKVRNRVLVLTNDPGKFSNRMRAIFDRGKLYYFNPPAEQVHREVAARGFMRGHADIMRWFDKHQKLIASPSMRLYVDARDAKLRGEPWQEDLLKSMIRAIVPKKVTRGGTPEQLAERCMAAIEILHDDRITKSADQVEAFRRATGLSRNRWFYYKRLIEGRIAFDELLDHETQEAA